MSHHSPFSQFPPPILTSSSSLSSATASPPANQHGGSWNPQTPAPASNRTMTLADLFRNAGLSPPSQSNTVNLHDEIIQVADQILSHCILEGRTSWEHLSEDKKVRLAFLIMKKQHVIMLKECNNNVQNMATNLWAALDPNQKAYETLTAFLRKGGDKSEYPDAGGMETNWWQSFLREHPDWNSNVDGSVYTLFAAGNSLMQPFVRFQTMKSKLCYFVSAANAILYYMIINNPGTQHIHAIEDYSINIGRSMRNSFTHQQVFQTIFVDDGGYPKHVLESLLTNASVTNSNCTEKTQTFLLEYDLDSDTIFKYVVKLLEHRGPVLVSDFRVFPAYTDRDTLVYSGEWEDWKSPDPTQNTLHAFLIVGVRKTEDGSMGGLQFLIQDSLVGRPFVVIGLDLFKSMEVEKFCVIKKGVSFSGTTAENGFDGVPSSVTSGSPFGTPLSDEGGVWQGSNAQEYSAEDEENTEDNATTLYFGFDWEDGVDPSKVVVIT